MSLSNTIFHPSRVEDRIYDLMMEEQYIISTEVYTDELFVAIHKMIAEEFPEVEYETFTTPSYNNGLFVQSFAWVEDGHIHLIGWEFKETEVD